MSKKASCFGPVALQESPAFGVSYKKFLQVSSTSVLQGCPNSRSALQEPGTSWHDSIVSYESVAQEQPTRLSYKSIPQEFRNRASYNIYLPDLLQDKSVSTRVSPLKECLPSVSSKRLIPDCPTLVFYKRVLQGCHTRVSHEFLPRVPTRLPRFFFKTAASPQCQGSGALFQFHFRWKCPSDPNHHDIEEPSTSKKKYSNSCGTCTGSFLRHKDPKPLQLFAAEHFESMPKIAWKLLALSNS